MGRGGHKRWSAEEEPRRFRDTRPVREPFDAVKEALKELRAVAKERAEAEEKAIKESVKHVKRFGPDELLKEMRKAKPSTPLTDVEIEEMIRSHMKPDPIPNRRA